MTSHFHIPGLLFIIFLITSISRCCTAQEPTINSTVSPFNCSPELNACNALLYHANNDLTKEQVASFYSVNVSQIKSLVHAYKEAYLITVPCSCSSTPNISGYYFYDVLYTVQEHDIFENVSSKYYDGQAWSSEENPVLYPGNNFTMHLVCGCVEGDSQIVVTYTVQQQDTLSDISTLLSAKLENLENLNRDRTQNPSFVKPGWVLFVPMEKYGLKTSSKGNKHKWEIVLGILVSVTVLSTSALIFVLVRRYQSKKKAKEELRAVSKVSSGIKSYSLQRQFANKENIEDVSTFESDRPVEFSLEEIEDATSSFAETKKIGQGGYGSVYYGILGEKEIAVKKMRSNKSKEFFAELKVLCKVHHINVVELLGCASGDDHLYLVYEFIQNGSLSDHLHDPLLKGHQPLSWTARTQIALGAAKGIEYIHDHTKARYVHRDIKTSNILLDEGLRAKVADFGLAKLVGRANEDDPIATRLVGTPGYLPPESVKELQVTPKADVFAFGVVLAELITGKRALVRDNREPAKMKSLITIVKNIFRDEDPESALQIEIDGNLCESYPIEAVFKMAEVAELCFSEDAVDRPEMRDVVVMLSQIVTLSTEWEASLGGNSQVFSGVFNGR